MRFAIFVMRLVAGIRVAKDGCCSVFRAVPVPVFTTVRVGWADVVTAAPAAILIFNVLFSVVGFAVVAAAAVVVLAIGPGAVSGCAVVLVDTAEIQCGMVQDVVWLLWLM